MLLLLFLMVMNQFKQICLYITQIVFYTLTLNIMS